MLDERGLACTDVGVLPIGTAAVDEVAETLAGLVAATGAPDLHRRVLCASRTCAGRRRARALRRDARPGRRAARARVCRVRRADATRRRRVALRGGGVGPLRRAHRHLALLPDRRSVGGASLARRGTDRARPSSTTGPPSRETTPCGRDGSAGCLLGRERSHWQSSRPRSTTLGYEGPLSTEVLSDDVRNRAPDEGARLLFASLQDCWPGS